MPDTDIDPRARQKLSGEIDNSLRGNSMRRALQQKVPKTLTPYEWQAWYKENGVPEEHRRPGSWVTKHWLRVKQWLGFQQVK